MPTCPNCNHCFTRKEIEKLLESSKKNEKNNWQLFFKVFSSELKKIKKSFYIWITISVVSFILSAYSALLINSSLRWLTWLAIMGFVTCYGFLLKSASNLEKSQKKIFEDWLDGEYPSKQKPV